jgi:hypothetical protein
MTDVVHQSHSEIETPVSAESAIDFCISQIRRAPDILRERLERFQDLKHLYDIKMAAVADATEGTELAKKRAAVLACVEERRDMDSAEAAYKYAQARTRAFEKELSGRQSVNKSVSTSYNTSGWRS